MSLRQLACAALCASALALGASASAAVIQIVNLDGPGEGFNDPTPRTPEGGNPGTTRGQQRLFVFQRAAAVWGALLRSNRIIKVGARFDSLVPCGGGSGILGQAGPTTFGQFAPVPPGYQAGTWYPVALMEAVLDQNVNAANNEIDATFNSDIDNACVNPGTRFWYGVNPAVPPAPNTFALFPTVLHELGHGLGFLTLVCVAPGGCGATPFGGLANGSPDIWTFFLAAASNQALLWKDMNNAQRAAGITSDPNLVWVGGNVTVDAPAFQIVGSSAINSGRMRMHAPNPAQPGSSVSHFTSAANPNLLMEPTIGGMTTQVDLTYSLFRDIGWQVNPRDTLFADGHDAR